jgi:hypothetical protein
MSLAEFLLARIAEDEDAAKGPLTQKWFAVGTEFPDDDSHPSEMLRGYVDSQGLAVTEDGDGPSVWHIARHDPARVLAECEAKRRIVELHGVCEADELDALIWAQGFDACRVCVSGGNVRALYPCPTLRVLALPYADRVDYQPEWRV